MIGYSFAIVLVFFFLFFCFCFLPREPCLNDRVLLCTLCPFRLRRGPVPVEEVEMPREEVPALLPPSLVVAKVLLHVAHQLTVQMHLEGE